MLGSVSVTSAGGVQPSRCSCAVSASRAAITSWAVFIAAFVVDARRATRSSVWAAACRRTACSNTVSACGNG